MKQIILSSILFLCVNFTLWATPYNIAPQAKVTASSVLNDTCRANTICDGLIGIENQGEWLSTSKMTFWGLIDYPWIQLEWEQARNINRIVLYDRATMQSHTAGGTLHFSDGSKILVHAIPNNGLAKTVDFPTKNVTWVKFEVTDGDGLQLGLSEIEV
jgi:hypothetical protein